MLNTTKSQVFRKKGGNKVGIKANAHAHAKKSSILVIVSFRSFSEPFPYFRVILGLFQGYFSVISGLFQGYFLILGLFQGYLIRGVGSGGVGKGFYDLKWRLLDLFLSIPATGAVTLVPTIPATKPAPK